MKEGTYVLKITKISPFSELKSFYQIVNQEMQNVKDFSVFGNDSVPCFTLFNPSVYFCGLPLSVLYPLLYNVDVGKSSKCILQIRLLLLS